MKKGDTIIMNFHCAGFTSTEELKVVSVTGDIVTTNETFNGDKGEEKRKFCLKTGKCLNDSNYFGSKRTINVKS